MTSVNSKPLKMKEIKSTYDKHGFWGLFGDYEKKFGDIWGFFTDFLGISHQTYLATLFLG